MMADLYLLVVITFGIIARVGVWPITSAGYLMVQIASHLLAEALIKRDVAIVTVK